MAEADGKDREGGLAGAFLGVDRLPRGNPRKPRLRQDTNGSPGLEGRVRRETLPQWNRGDQHRSVGVNAPRPDGRTRRSELGKQCSNLR